MASSKAFFLLSIIIIVAVTLHISSDVAARQLADSYSTQLTEHLESSNYSGRMYSNHVSLPKKRQRFLEADYPPNPTDPGTNSGGGNGR